MAVKFAFGLLSLLPAIALAQEGGNELADPPQVCIPSSNVDKYNHYAWYDESAVCAAQGVAQSCCVTAIATAIGCDDMTPQDVTDLISVVAQQVPKGGWTDTSTVGVWNAGYQLFESTALDTNIQIEFDNAIQYIFPTDNLTGSAVISALYFQAVSDDGLTSIYVDRNC